MSAAAAFIATAENFREQQDKHTDQTKSIENAENNAH